jgi:beta-1,4-mannosyl-glycoprotein beta-1,4-N-acetylglucosaminyltransferase
VIIDVFMFNDELDMLRCRIHELSPVVDEFVAVSGTHTLAGDPKPDYLDGFEHPQLTKLMVDNYDVTGVEVHGGWIDRKNMPNWQRDKKQRQGVEPYLAGKSEDDIIMFSDVDEIPKRDAILSRVAHPHCLRMRMFIYSLAWEEPSGWAGTVVTQRSHRYDWGDYHFRRDLPASHYQGWHLTWFGGPAAVQKKVSEFAHPELRDLIMPRYEVRGRPADGSPLSRYTGEDKPRWVKEGLAPASWSLT